MVRVRNIFLNYEDGAKRLSYLWGGGETSFLSKSWGLNVSLKNGANWLYVRRGEPVTTARRASWRSLIDWCWFRGSWCRQGDTQRLDADGEDVARSCMERRDLAWRHGSDELVGDRLVLVVIRGPRWPERTDADGSNIWIRTVNTVSHSLNMYCTKPRVVVVC